MAPHLVPLWSTALACSFFFLWLLACHRFHCGRLYGTATFLFFFCLGHGLLCRQYARTDYPFPEESSIYKVCLRENPEEKANSILCRVALTEERRGDTLCPFSHPPVFLLYFPKDTTATALRQGDELLVYTRLSPPANNGNPDEFDYVRHLKHKGVTGTAYVPAGCWRVVGHSGSLTLRQRALACREKVLALYRRAGIGGDELAVLSALTVGDKEKLDDDIVETYSVSGASHVLALSGLHIGFIYAAFWWMFSLVWRRWRPLKPFLLLTIPVFLWGFAFLSGLPSSVVRSVTMFSLLTLAGLQPEKPLTMNTMLATAFLMLLCHPVWLFDVGFQLSFAAVTAILLIQPRLFALCRFKNRPLRYVWGLLTVSVAAQLGTAPLVMFYFSRFSTHFLLTNLWVIPMVTLVLYAAACFLLSTLFPPLQQLLAGVVDGLVHAQNEVLRWIEHLPYASIDGIWMDAWEVLLCYLFVALAVYGCVRRTARSLGWALFALLAVVSFRTVSTYLHAPQSSLMFYNVRGCQAVHCLTEGRQSWLVCADSLPDISRLDRSLSPHWNRLHLDRPQPVVGEYASDGLLVRHHMLYYLGTSVCLLNDNRWRGKTAACPVTVDYLYVGRGYDGNLRELSPLFAPRTVVLDASLSVYRRESLIGECREQGIPYLSLARTGAVRILL